MLQRIHNSFGPQICAYNSSQTTWPHNPQIKVQLLSKYRTCHLQLLWKDVIHYLRQNYRYVTDSENNRVQVFATDYYPEKNIRIHPIFMSIKFHHYNNLWN